MESPIILIIFKNGLEQTSYTIHKIQNIDKYQVVINHKQKIHAKVEATESRPSLYMNTYSLKYYMNHQIFESSPTSVYFELNGRDFSIIQFEWEKEEGENDDEFEKTLVQILELQKGIYL